jgi:hypothetical protein
MLLPAETSVDLLDLLHSSTVVVVAIVFPVLHRLLSH